MSEKFSCDLAEELYELTMTNDQDDDLGDGGTFGWFALFRKQGAILSVDSQGYAGVSLPSDLEFSWSELEKEWVWFQVAHLDESCDGLFLLLDEARHGGEAPDLDEIYEHVTSCLDCLAVGNELEF